MFKKIMTAGIMCLALANSAAAQGAAGAAGTGAGGVVIGQSWSIIIRSVLNCGNLPIEVQF